MSLPTSLGSYLDCRALYDAATADPKGARACLGTYEACVNMRTRMHYFRVLDRRANEAIYPKDSPQWGTSVYDDYVIQLTEDTAGEWWMYIRPRSAKVLEVQGLSEVEAIEVDGDEVHLIEDRSNG